MVGLVFMVSMLHWGGAQVNGKVTQVAASGVMLIMFEQEGCHYSQVWEENIGGSYHKTPEGKFAPLKKVDIHSDEHVANVKPVVFTPTFVLYKDGHEVGRLTGYISDDFFWGLLGSLLRKHGYRDGVQETDVSQTRERME
jgi:thioredoxin-related protein